MTAEPGSVWMQTVERCLDEALELLAAVVRDCPDDRWRTPMWHVRPSEIPGDTHDADGKLVTEPAAREALIQRWATPWSVAWHTLEVFDYDLSGELEPWSPPAPFKGKPHWRTFASLPDPWTKADIAGYVDHCRRRLAETFPVMSKDKAATPLPPAHRYAGQRYADIVARLIGHTTAHAIQIRQFGAL